MSEEDVLPENERIRKTAKPSGNTCRIYLPKDWEGDEILAINLDSGSKGGENMVNDKVDNYNNDVKSWYSDAARKIAKEVFDNPDWLDTVSKLTLWADGGITLNNKAETETYIQESVEDFLSHVDDKVL